MIIKDHQTYEKFFKFTQEDVELFARVTGDTNPIHLDVEYAKNTIFKKPIMHGFLSASIFSRIFGTEFPGIGTIYLSQNLKFMKPMFSETEYKATVFVKHIDSEKNLVTLETKVIDETGKITLDGEALIRVN